MTAPRAFTHDLIVVGAGPAGMAAAATGARVGLRTLLLDEQPCPGGQIHRHATRASPALAALLGPSQARGAALAAELAASGAECLHGALVWDVDRDLAATVLHGGRARRFAAPQLVAATGALERPSPLPGWTLPGVLNAGAAQVALKTAGTVPAGRVVLAGGGPLLLLVAVQLLRAGADVAALVETSPRANVVAAARHAWAALGQPGPLWQGAAMIAALRWHRVPWFTRATGLEVLGDTAARALRFAAGGRPHTVDADTVLLHHGVVPDTQLTRLLRAAHRWDERQAAWCPVLDADGQSSVAGLRVAGDGGGIAGARAAEHGGALAALAAAHALGRLDADEHARRAAPYRRARARQARLRPFLDALYRPPRELLLPADETVVCRCEEVTAGRVREMARLGCRGPNQTKAFSRCGMGPCQGRQCGGTVTQLLADELGRPPQQVGAYRVRAPLKPVPLAALAALDDGDGGGGDGDDAA